MTSIINPKSHDSLFKWLITAFTEDFFAHYFPQVNIGRYEFIDKEFIQRYEALKANDKDTDREVSEETIDEVKKEVNMEYPATSITEHIRLEGEKIGEERGEKKGFMKGCEEGRIEGEKIGEERGEKKGFMKGCEEGRIEGEIKTLEVLYEEGLLSLEEFKKRVTPLHQKLIQLLRNHR